jgi:hypothetical protein
MLVVVGMPVVDRPKWASAPASHRDRSNRPGISGSAGYSAPRLPVGSGVADMVFLPPGSGYSGASGLPIDWKELVTLTVAVKWPPVEASHRDRSSRSGISGSAGPRAGARGGSGVCDMVVPLAVLLPGSRTADPLLQDLGNPDEIARGGDAGICHGEVVAGGGQPSRPEQPVGNLRQCRARSRQCTWWFRHGGHGVSLPELGR